MIYPFVWGYYGIGFEFIVRKNHKISLRISKGAFLRPETTLCSPLLAARSSHRWQYWWYFQRNPNHKSLADEKAGPDAGAEARSAANNLAAKSGQLYRPLQGESSR
jgi:hypothetical protein